MSRGREVGPLSLPKEYRDLAKLRVETRWPDYQQPEDFGYDFRDWVSPYTKTACRLGSVAVVLQDWASADGLRGGPDADIQQYGRTPRLRTNRMLDSLLRRVFGLSLPEVYATNAFPFVKRGAMSNPVPLVDVVKAVQLSAATELAIARPTVVVAAGAAAHSALSRVGIAGVRVPQLEVVA